MPDLQNVKASAANLLWFLYSAGMARKWQHATFDVAGAQQAVLKRILSSNAATVFGQEHHFARIDSVEAYQNLVPLRTYEEFKPYIDRIAEGELQVLTSEPSRQFALTSGSTQAAKLIPCTKAMVNEFQEGIDPWVNYLFRSFPRLLFGKAYWSVTPVGERKSRTSGGISIGFDDEKQYFSPLTRWVLRLYHGRPISACTIAGYGHISLCHSAPAASGATIIVGIDLESQFFDSVA